MNLLTCPSALAHEHSLAHPAEGRHSSAQFCKVPGRRHPTLVGNREAKRQALKVGFVPEAATVKGHSVEVGRRRAVEVVGAHPCLHRRAVVPHWAEVAKGEVFGLGVGALEYRGRAGGIGDDVAGEQPSQERLARLNAGDDGRHTDLGVCNDTQGRPDPWRALRPKRPGHRRVRYGRYILL